MFESGLGEGGKPVLVKAVVAESAIEAFNKSVLHGLSRLDVMKVTPVGRAGRDPGESKFLKHIDDGGTTDGGIDMDSQAHP